MAVIVAHFATILKNLKRLLTAWGTYRIFYNLTPPYFQLNMNWNFNLHFIFCPFTTVTSILNYSKSFGSSFLWVMCDDAPLSPNHPLKLLFVMILGDFSAENNTNEEVFDIILFIIFLCPKSICSVTFLSTVVEFSIEAYSSNIFCVPSISRSVTILATVLAFTLEELGIGVLFLFCVQC